MLNDLFARSLSSSDLFILAPYDSQHLGRTPNSTRHDVEAGVSPDASLSASLPLAHCHVSPGRDTLDGSGGRLDGWWLGGTQSDRLGLGLAAVVDGFAQDSHRFLGRMEAP
jgi:hypothetical protein